MTEGACSDGPLTVSTGAGVPELRVVPLDLAPQHLLWWNELRECTGRERPIEEVTFLAVTHPLSGDQFPCIAPGRFCNGLYFRDTVFISARLLDNERTVKHEMLHALQRGPGHGDDFFRCTG